MVARLGSTMRLVSGLLVALLVVWSTFAFGQSSTASILGTVTDQSGAAVAGATVTITNTGTGLQRVAQTDASGNYGVPTLPVGVYKVEAKSPGLQTQVANNVELLVNQNSVQNFNLKVAQASEVITIEATAPVIESTTMTVGQVIDSRTTQEIPLNGRHFVDLASLAPGTVVPPSNGFLTAPLRGQGGFGVVTAGNREDTTNFMINGINLNDMANGQITFQPSINTVSEFKIDNSTPSAEYGRNSGATVNIATRSGSNDFHGEAFEFIRNEDLDARNFFNKEFTGSTKQAKNPFKRNQFGGAIGGPIWKNHTFFFGSYEGLRQRQGLALSATVPTADQRTAVTNPTIQKLLQIIPQGTGGGPSFLGSAVAPVDIDQGTGDLSHTFSENDRLHGYYVFQRDKRGEPNLSGATIPGGGDTRQSHRQIFTLNETHIFSPNVVNDFRAGLNRIRINFVADVQNAGLDPSTFGIANGVTGPIGIPQITVSGSNLVFGGERNFPQGRGDLTSVISDDVSYLHGRHSFKFGGEYRRVNNNTFSADEGSLGFANMNAFLAGTPNAFAINLGGSHPARIVQQATGLFGMDSFKVTPYFTAELGLRWEWNFTPTEARNRSTVFLQDKLWLAQIGTNGLEEYHQNNKLFQPRVGFAWDLFHNGKTVLRSGYGIAYDQPLPIISSGNPPFGVPVSFVPVTSGSNPKPTTTFASLLPDAQAAGLTIASADRNYDDSYTQSYNLNLQQQLTSSLAMMVGYFGSKGTHLNTQINVNQLVPTATPGVYARPYPFLAADSPIIPKDAAGRPLTALGNVTSNESIGTSNYNALWVTGTKHMSRGLLFNANYTWSKSMDINSRNFQGLTVQDSLHPFADRGLSDFDARHHFTFSSIYDLPFHGNRFTEGWRLGGIVTLQSGNPLNIIAGSAVSGTGNSGFTGAATVRPDLIGPVPSVGTKLISNAVLHSGAANPNVGRIQWFPSNIVCDPSAPVSCTSSSVFALPLSVIGGRNAFHFGSLSRNAIPGPDFKNVDFSISKTTKITERFSHELRIEAFDLFNHPNFANPNTTAVFSAAGTSSFGVISATRNPTGDAGSSRQFQIAMKLLF